MKKFLIIVLVLAFLGESGYLVYDKVLNKETSKKVEKKEEELTDEELNINSQLVQTLYNYVRVDGNLDGSYIIGLLDKNKIVKSKDIKNDYKNFMGYRLVHNTDKEHDNCPETLYKNKKCGIYDQDLDKVLEIAVTISEEKLKRNVELIFGENSYKSESFSAVGYTTGGLLNYDEETKKYYDTDCQCGGTGWGPITELKKAVKNKDAIKITEYVKNEFDDKLIELTIEYTFKKADNGDYYFESLKKVK